MKRGVFLVLCVGLWPLGLKAESLEEQLWHLRNLGKAFYENAATQYEAVGQFKKALDLAPTSAREHVNYGLALMRGGKVEEGIVQLKKAQALDPAIPHTWFNLGIAYKQQSVYDKATEQLEGMIARVPDEAISHYNLGLLYKLNKRSDEALRHLERAAALDQNLAGPRFQLATSYRQLKRPEDAKRTMADFKRIKKEQAGAAVTEDLEWSFYSEIYETIDPTQMPTTPPQAELVLEEEMLAPFTTKGLGLIVLDAEGDGRVELLSWSADQARLLRFSGAGHQATDLSGVFPVSLRQLTAGDFNNDGLADLCAVHDQGVTLYSNDAGAFKVFPAELPKGDFSAALWLDYDHDYDLDLFLLGASSYLLRNNGAAGFSDYSDHFPFVQGHALSGTLIDLVTDTQGMDLAVSYTDRPGVLYRDRLSGRYQAQDLDALPAGTRLQGFDFDNDGWTDLAAGGAGADADGQKVVLLRNDHQNGFATLHPIEAPGAGPLLFADLENRGVSELLVGAAIYRNQGQSHFSRDQYRLSDRPLASLVKADFNADGRLDLAAIDIQGGFSLYFNKTVGDHHWLALSLNGVKNLKRAPGAEIEVKAGFSYQKKIYQGLPLSFGLGPHKAVDTVRITWPNGLIQNEPQRRADSLYSFAEAQRLSGSCPMIYTWNGTQFEYITDVLGVAPLGASAGDGEYFPVDHDEYIQISGTSLQAVNDQYEIRIVEELREIAYLDEIRLIAVDHPSQMDIFTNDKFKGPPFPEFRLFGVEQRQYPVKVTDHRGHDVRPRVLAKDRSYPDAFGRDYGGVAELHYLDLDFGAAVPNNRAVMILSGWVDWADGSTFLGASQEGGAGLILPYLQVKNADDLWQTVIEDMGIPAGKPKTITVDLSGKFLSAARQVRIVTNLCVYWDEIFISEETGQPPVKLTEVHAGTAALGFGGFSKAVIHPQRKQPEHFIYGERRNRSMWNPTPGDYTRYGEVATLIDSIDDRFVIMGSGDELRLRFNADVLPPLEHGWARDFLLFVDGWAKDGDANTAFSQTVKPLPYHAMPHYPYAAPYQYPTDGAHQRYQEFYNMRPALRLIRPLTEGLESAFFDRRYDTASKGSKVTAPTSDTSVSTAD